MKKRILYLSILMLIISTALYADKKNEEKEKDSLSSETFSGLKFRLIGPAVTSGRIIDFAVNPYNNYEFYVAVASGGVWKTTNNGTSFKPIFDKQGSYSIGCVTIDPNNTNVVWVGSGENNSQRSVSYGDGIYKSLDGGKTWNNMGLKESEHIGKIIIDPTNSDVVYVAAQGPLWRPGGDRGLYKTIDGGKTWEKSLEISENTGISDIVMDPRDPNVIYASSYQRRRHVWTLLNGGPEGAIYKTTDGGATWNKLKNGLPSGDIGRIGLAISPVNPDYVFALIEASEDRSGFYRSTDRGASWEKRTKYNSSSAQYYQEIFCDPKDLDLIYSVETYTKYSKDGGKTWNRLGLKERHVDDHALWIDPNNTDHLLIGGDGGIYQTYDKGETWRFFENLPVTQFYRVGLDNAEPFYHAYGGTQDNNTLGAPVRTTSAYGITNSDWIFTVGGDGFKTVVDPTDHNIIYSQPQYGWLVRYDKRSGEYTGIQPQPEEGEELRWNWNSPVIISPHSHTTLYFAANKLFKSTDRGNSWVKISDDLTRQINRNKLEIMGKVWDPEAVSKNASTSLYGNIVSLNESTLKKGLLYVGTDDGLIQVTENDGQSWTKYSKFVGVPETTYVVDIEPSLHDVNTVYAAFDNRKHGDFKPYLLKSSDKGMTWTDIAGNLPDNGTVHTIAQDHVNSNLLFVGTEFAVFFTVDGGNKWTKLSSGLPTIAVKDMEIQRRENDLVLATFGRGIYVLDDYSSLRQISKETLEKQAHIYPIKDALMFIEDRSKARRSLGETFYRADNPPFGATFTYYFKEPIKTKKQLRKDKSKDEKDKEETTIDYPSFAELKSEDLEESPSLMFVIEDMSGNVIRMLKAPNKAGVNRITWDLRRYSASSVTKKTDINKHSGLPVVPGDYFVKMYKSEDGKLTLIAGPEKFTCKPLHNTTLPAENMREYADFIDKAHKLQLNVSNVEEYLKQINNRIKLLKKTIKATHNTDPNLLAAIRNIEYDFVLMNDLMNGDDSKSKRNANQTPSISNRLGTMLYSLWFTRSAPTTTNKQVYNIIEKQTKELMTGLNKLVNEDIKAIENKLDEIGAPWTPGRIPQID